MSPRSAYRAGFAGFLLTSIGLTLLTLYVEPGYLAATLVNLGFWSWKLRQPCCAHCETPLAPPVGASLAALLRSFRARDCAHCGRRLDLE